MKIQDADERLGKAANGKCHSVDLELITYADGTKRSQCRLYVEGQGFFTAPTFKAAFMKLEGRIEEMPDVEA